VLARAFVAIGGLVVLALLAALVAPLFIDWTNYRQDFEREASLILGRKVTVAGTASARLIPFPSVTFSDVRVGGDDDSPAMTFDAFSMDAELAPFLSGQVLIFDMRIDRPRATVTIAADGTVDWALRPSTSIDPARVALERVTIRNGEIRLRHGPSGRDHFVRGLAATVSARSLEGPWRIEGEGRFDAVEAQFSATTGRLDEDGLRIVTRVQPKFAGFTVETDGAATLQAGRPSYSGRIAIDQQVAEGADHPGFRIRGAVTADAAMVTSDSFRLETGPVKEPYVAEGKASIVLGAEPRFALSIEGHQMRLDEKGTGAGRPLAERLADLAETIVDLPRPALPGTIAITVPAIVIGDTTLREVRLDGAAAEGGWTIKTLSAQLPGRTTVEASGFLAGGLTPAFSGDLLLAVAQPSGFAAWLGQEADEAIRRLPGAGLQGHANLTRERQSLSELEIRLGEAAFHGNFDRVTAADGSPSIDLDLDGGALDLAAVEALASLFGGAGVVDGLSGQAARMALRAGPVDFGGLVAERVDTALRLTDGRLEIDRLLVDGLAGAHVSATATITGLGGAASGTVDGSVIGDDLAPLFGELADRYPFIAGPAALAERAALWPGLFADSRLDFLATLAAAEPAHRLAVSAHGVAGGTDFTLQAAGDIADWALVADRKATFSFDGSNDDAAALAALAGLPALPLGLTPGGRLTAELAGAPATGYQAKLALSAEDSSVRFDGRLGGSPAAVGRLVVTSDDVGPWLATAGLAAPGLAEGFGAELAAAARLDGGQLALAGLTGTIAGATVAGDVAFGWQSGQPVGSGSLSVSGLDLPVILRGLFGDAVVAGDAAWSDEAFAARPALPLSGRFAVASPRVTTGWGPELTAASMQLVLGPESVTVSDLAAGFGGGRLNASGEARNSGGDGSLAAQVSVTGADLGGLGHPMAGTADLTLSLTGSGRSPAALVAALAGSGTLAVDHLQLTGIDPGALPAIVEAADALGPQITAADAEAVARQAALSGSGRFGPGRAALSVANGIARADNLSLDSPGARLDIDARLDLAEQALTATGRLAYAPGAFAVVGGAPDIAISVDGPIAAPAVTVDAQAIGQFLVQRALEAERARVEATQAALAEKQRLRREIRYFQALAARRARAAEALRIDAEARAALEAQRRAAEIESLLQYEALVREEEARKAAEEEARKAEARKAAEEEARKAAEEEARKAEVLKAAEEEARKAAEEEAREAASAGSSSVTGEDPGGEPVGDAGTPPSDGDEPADPAENTLPKDIAVPSARPAPVAPATPQDPPALASERVAPGPAAAPDRFPEAPKPKPGLGRLLDLFRSP